MKSFREHDNILSDLYKANRKIRESRPFDSQPGHCVYFRGGDLLEISVPCSRCPHDAEGKCVMCNYGLSEPVISAEQLEQEALGFIREKGQGIRKLLLCTNGATLDPRCVPRPFLDVLLSIAQKCEAEKIIIETHLDTINEEILQHIRSVVTKPVLLELGLESVDSFVQHYCYMKDIPINRMEEAIRLGKEMGFSFQLNLMLGAPFLNINEQIEDTENSIRWALDRVDYVTLFPMNIKPYTLLRFAYDSGLYKQISHWMMAVLLDRFPGDNLMRIDLAWYGNRDIDYGEPTTETIFPVSCNHCHEKLIQFYEKFNESETADARKRIVKDILTNGETLCDCYADVLSQIGQAADTPLESRAERVFEQQIKLLHLLKDNRLI